MNTTTDTTAQGRPVSTPLLTEGRARRTIWILFAVVALVVVAPLTGFTLVKQRQAGMTLIAKYFGPLGGMAAGRVPYDAAVVTRNAGYLEVLAHTPWDGFAASTSSVP